MFKHNHRFSTAGFTLIEVLVSVMILAILTVTMALLFDPLAQLNKAADAQRKQDIAQIKSALDAYFNDTGCYPQSIPFGSAWKVGSTIYMQKVPQDPGCGNKGGYCYIYQTDNTLTCPQWDILYAHLSQNLTFAQVQASCPIWTVCKSVVNSKYNYCSFSGNLNCTYVKNTPLPTPGPVIPPTPTPAPGLQRINCQGQYYAVAGIQCNYLPAGDPNNRCTIHGGDLVCYSAGSIPPDPDCTGFPCLRDR